MNTSLSLEGKTIYAFGDSIVYGHTAPQTTFMTMLAKRNGMILHVYAVNGASVMCLDSTEKESADETTQGNYIINQIKNAPSKSPDIILFDGGTNDAYGTNADRFNQNGTHPNVLDHIGEIKGCNAKSFDNKTFCGGFEEIIYTLKNKYPNVPIVFLTIHKSGGRDFEIQKILRKLELEICEKWNVAVADTFKETDLDTRNAEQMSRYIIGGGGSHPNAECCAEFYVPLIQKKLEEILG